MKKSNKKGFTIVELVIVIAVIAILAAVLIPTFASIVRKANISNDTMLAKNLNTALAADEAVNDAPEDFDEVISILRENGFLIANLNPSADGCYFVWESKTNQILLVDGKADYKVLFSAKDGYAEVGKTWNFAVSNVAEQAKVKADLSGKNVTFRTTIANVKDLSAALANDGTIYLDDSVEINKNNVIKVGKATTINLGNSALNTKGVIDVVPIVINNNEDEEKGKGDLTILGGSIGTAGKSVNADRKDVAVSIFAADGTKVYVEGTKINMASTRNGYVNLAGDATFKDATIDTSYIGVGVYGKSQTTLDNTVINSTGRCVFVSNYLKKYDKDGATVRENGNPVVVMGHNDEKATAKLTIESGTYHGDYTPDEDGKLYVPIVAYSGDIVINDGNFSSGANNTEAIFDVMHKNGSITITGGTFNGKEFSSIKTVDEWKALCNSTKLDSDEDGAADDVIVINISKDKKTVTITRPAAPAAN